MLLVVVDLTLSHSLPERKCDKCGKSGVETKQLFKGILTKQLH